MYLKVSLAVLLFVLWIAAIVLLFVVPAPSWVQLIARLVPCYTLLITLDSVVAVGVEQHYLFYPTTDFKCFCEYEEKLMGRWFLPNRLCRFYKVKKHTKSCLAWILNADFNSLTPYFALAYARDLRKPSLAGLSDSWYLEWAKHKSKLAREGKDPWEESII